MEVRNQTDSATVIRIVEQHQVISKLLDFWELLHPLDVVIGYPAERGKRPALGNAQQYATDIQVRIFCSDVDDFDFVARFPRVPNYLTVDGDILANKRLLFLVQPDSFMVGFGLL